MEYFEKFRRASRRCGLGLVVLALASLVVYPALALAEESTPKEQQELNVTSDYLITDRTAGYAEFQGNVVATQQGSVLTSERLKITFTEKKDDEKEPSDKKKDSSEGAIDTIVATGKVKMVMEDKTAWAEKAVFNSREDTITLTGGKPKVISGKSSMTGDRIVIKRSTGQVMAYSGEKGPVNVIIFQEDLDKAESKK